MLLLPGAVNADGLEDLPVPVLVQEDQPVESGQGKVGHQVDDDVHPEELQHRPLPDEHQLEEAAVGATGGVGVPVGVDVVPGEGEAEAVARRT